MKVNEFNDLNKHNIEVRKLKDLDFSNDDCPFFKDFCFEYDGWIFEDLRDCGSDEEDGTPVFIHDFRVVLAQNDYDYVEDEELITKLKRARDGVQCYECDKYYPKDKVELCFIEVPGPHPGCAEFAPPEEHPVYVCEECNKVSNL